MDKNLIKSFKEGKSQLFIGSGLSAGYYPTADQFREMLLNDPSYEYSPKHSLKEILGDSPNISLEDAAEFFESYRDSESLLQIIKDTYRPKEGSEPTLLHQKLWKLPNTKFIYTTNYDCLIEDAIERPKESPDVIVDPRRIRGIDKSRRIVFKPHGCARKSIKRSEFVITRNDYLNYSYYKPLEYLKTSYDISEKTFIFLGYSLKDLNMRYILTEAHRISSSKKAYAVMKDISGAEARYWKDLKVTLIEMDADNFLDELLSHFSLDETEWSEKVSERNKEKKRIANKALNVIKEQVKAQHLNIIIDAGSTCLQIINALIARIEQDIIPGNRVTIITNSIPAISAISKAKFKRNKEPVLISVGGSLKYGTQALIPDSSDNFSEYSVFLDNKPTISFIGVTSIDEDGLKTKTEDEVSIKKTFIKLSDQVYILADHSKRNYLPKDKSLCFSSWEKDKMTIITDRKEALDVFSPYVINVL